MHTRMAPQRMTRELSWPGVGLVKAEADRLASTERPRNSQTRLLANIRALIIRIGFGGLLYYNFKK